LRSNISSAVTERAWGVDVSGTRQGHLLDTWQDLIVNYFINHQSSGFVEGLNNKLKVLKRRCYGLRNVVRLFQRLTLDLEGYRRFSPWRDISPRYSGVHGNS